VRILANPRHAASVERRARDTADERGLIEREIASCDEIATAMSDRLGNGEITLARYDAVTRPLDERLRVLRGKLGALGDRATGTRPLRSAQWWEERWETDQAGRRGMLLDAFRGRKLFVGPGQPAVFDKGRVQLR
jgi:site-specific DNA recombinase